MLTDITDRLTVMVFTGMEVTGGDARLKQKPRPHPRLTQTPKLTTDTITVMLSQPLSLFATWSLNPFAAKSPLKPPNKFPFPIASKCPKSIAMKS